MNVSLARLVLLSLLLAMSTVLQAEQSEDSAAQTVKPATLRFWNRDIVTFRTAVRGLTPLERVRRAQDRLSAMSPQLKPEDIVTEQARIGDLEGTALVSHNLILFFILPGDVDPLSSDTLEELAGNANRELREALTAREEQLRPQLWLESALECLAATAALGLTLWLLGRLRGLVQRFTERVHRRIAMPVFGIDLRRYLVSAESKLVAAGSVVAALGAIYVWLVFVLNRFPYTSPWGQQLGDFLLGVLLNLGRGAVAAVPGLFITFVIFVLARYGARLVTNGLRSIEQGQRTVSWLDRDTAKVTRWVALSLIWLFAVIVAYPYIPGSDSVAFKGVSVFAGLMLTIGSSGFVGHLVSGLIVVYSRAVRTGEMIKVGDTFGTVSELGAFSTRIVTARGEEVNIPNAVLIASTVTNYSRLAGKDGTLFTTKVTIGYDAPWRQVHALLVLAADRTAGLRKDPKPYVMQRALSDFYVEYELFARLQRTESWFAVQSELHARIQDAFNEFGVQIMSPHFMIQPDRPVVVPKSQWQAAPAATEPTNKDGSAG